MIVVLVSQIAMQLAHHVPSLNVQDIHDLARLFVVFNLIQSGKCRLRCLAGKRTFSSTGSIANDGPNTIEALLLKRANVTTKSIDQMAQFRRADASQTRATMANRTQHNRQRETVTPCRIHERDEWKKKEKSEEKNREKLGEQPGCPEARPQILVPRFQFSTSPTLDTHMAL